jgi:hypothetical protein
LPQAALTLTRCVLFLPLWAAYWTSVVEREAQRLWVLTVHPLFATRISL